MKISFFGKTWIRGQFDPLFPEHNSLGQGLDAVEVFPGNREAISRLVTVLCDKKVVHFKSESKLILIWFKTGSDLIQNWFRSDSKLVQIWFKTEFGCPLTLPVRCGGRKRPWHFRLIQHWRWMPSHPSCHVCREEEALTFPDCFNTEFCCPLMSCAEMRRLWHFQTYSSLNPLPSLKLLVANHSSVQSQIQLPWNLLKPSYQEFKML